jgi:hypothetical protein
MLAAYKGFISGWRGQPRQARAGSPETPKPWDIFNSTPFILLHVSHCFSDQLMCMTYCFCSKPLSKTKWSVTWHGRLSSQQRKQGSARCSRMLLLHQSINKYKMAALLGCYGKFVGTSWDWESLCISPQSTGGTTSSARLSTQLIGQQDKAAVLRPFRSLVNFLTGAGTIMYSME